MERKMRKGIWEEFDGYDDIRTEIEAGRLVARKRSFTLDFAEQYPDRIGVSIGYDEALAHQIEAGADLFLMPSRFEPCGLNQMYSLHYGTLPVVRNVGGLADTVVNSSATNLASGEANGFVFSGEQPGDLVQVMHHALQLFENNLAWKKLQITGMWRDFSWDHSAREYIRLYDQLH